MHKAYTKAVKVLGYYTKIRLQNTTDLQKTNQMDYIKIYYLDKPLIKHSIKPKQRLPFNKWIDYVYTEVKESKISDKPINTSENKAVLSPLSVVSEG